MLKFNVTNQTLCRADRFSPATDSVEYLKAEFNFVTDDWAGATIRAIFRLGEKKYDALIKNGVCTVPHEVLVCTSEGYLQGRRSNKIFVTLVGIIGETRITTNEVRIDLAVSGYGETEGSSEVTPDVFTQFVNEVKADADRAEAATEEIKSYDESIRNSYANAFKGSASGKVVSLDDVSPIEHNPIVKVYGKNQFSTNDLLVDKGSAYGGIPIPFYGVPGKTYTVSANFEQLGTITKIGISLTTSDGRWLKEVYGDLTSGKLVVSFTYPAFYAESGFVSIGFFSNILPQAAEGAKCHYTNIQVEEGTVATDYTPYIDPSTVNVKRCGKNLLKNTATTQTVDGVSFTVNANGSVKAVGTSTATAPIRYVLGEALLSPGSYYITGQNDGTAKTFIMYSDQDGNFLQQFSGQDAELILTEATTINVYLVVLEKAAAVNMTAYPMIRLASVADATFEPYNGTEYTPATDGTVPNLTSLSPSMTILTDTTGAFVECVYNRDTDKAMGDIATALDTILSMQNSLLGGEM